MPSEHAMEQSDLGVGISTPPSRHAPAQHPRHQNMPVNTEELHLKLNKVEDIELQVNKLSRSLDFFEAVLRDFLEFLRQITGKIPT